MIRRNSIFLGLWLAAIVSLVTALCLVDKATFHLALCDHHSAFSDAVMPFLSDLVNWLPYAVAVGLLIWRWRAGVVVSGSLILSTLLTQAVKHLVRAPRPLTWFAEHHSDISLPLTEGVKMNYYNSFPSGHTTTFFCLFFAVCMVVTCYDMFLPMQSVTDKKNTSPDNRKTYRGISLSVQILCFLLAAVCSYSRIYLSQHFALDVTGGMVIGVVSVLIVAAIYRAIRTKRATLN